MLLTRFIPGLLIKGSSGLYKGEQFSKHRYVGDPMNAIRIFNLKQVDELCLLDITATKEKRSISPELVERVAAECLMPLAVGGGISNIEVAANLFRLGVEKVVVNSAAFSTPIVSEIASRFGSQAVVVSIDYKSNWLGRAECYTESGAKKLGMNPIEAAIKAEALGAGEILLTSIEREGTGTGFDCETIGKVSSAVKIPVIANGGAGGIAHFAGPLKQGGAHAVSAGRMFVFHGPRNAVLISYPQPEELEMVLK